jgi:uncharacterized protein (TIGR03067 family)
MKFRLFVLLGIALLLAAGTPQADPNKEDLGKMQGDWEAASMTRDGQKIPDDDAQALFRTVKGNEYTVFHFRKALGKGTFTIDATKKPKIIDAQPANLPQPMYGIYEIDGNTFKVCFAGPGGERPTDFSAKKGSGHTLTIWEREKK